MSDHSSPSGSNTPSASNSGPLAGFACFSIYAANLAMGRLYGDLLKRFGLTYPQYLVMVALGQRDGQKVSELGEALALESNTLTPLLKRLEAAGWLTRRRDLQDERVLRLSLTEAGRAMAEELDCIPPAVLAASGLTREELAAIQSGLHRLTAQLNTRHGDKQKGS